MLLAKRLRASLLGRYCVRSAIADEATDDAQGQVPASLHDDGGGDTNFGIWDGGKGIKNLANTIDKKTWHFYDDIAKNTWQHIRSATVEREEILTKSRQENKFRDIFEKEVLKEGGYAGSITAAVLATAFFVIQILLGEGWNYGLYAVVFSISATGFVIKAVRMKRRCDILSAAGAIVIVLVFSAAHIAQLVSLSAIL